MLDGGNKPLTMALTMIACGTAHVRVVTTFDIGVYGFSDVGCRCKELHTRTVGCFHQDFSDDMGAVSHAESGLCSMFHLLCRVA